MIRIAAVVAAIGVGVAILVGEFRVTAGLPLPTVTPPRVVYVSYVDQASDDRGYLDFNRLSDALQSFRVRSATDFSLEFVKVVVDGPQTIDDKLRELVDARPAVIVATSHDVLEAAKRATQSIPILFMSHEDPVDAGHVRSIALPGVRRTGFTFYLPMLAKAVELLTDGYPGTARIGVLVDTDMVKQATLAQELKSARAAFAADIELFVADNKAQLAGVLRSRSADRMDAWYVPVGATIWNDRKAVIDMMASTSKPVLYNRTFLVREGGLMSYEADIVDPFRIWASQLLLILNGVDASTIPVERPSRFELALNLASITSNARLRPSKSLLRRADVLLQ